MKVGDIVKVHDGSWCMFYAGRGELQHTTGTSLVGRQWRVIAVGGVFPTENQHYRDIPTNDVMLSEKEYPEHILFTSEVHCTVVSRPKAKEVEPVTCTVPIGTKSVVIEFI